MTLQLFFKDRLKDFASDRCEADGSELLWVCCAGGFATGVTITTATAIHVDA